MNSEKLSSRAQSRRDSPGRRCTITYEGALVGPVIRSATLLGKRRGYEQKSLKAQPLFDFFYLETRRYEMQKTLTVLFAVAVLAVGFATPADAKPPNSCDPWPACKGAGESTCNDVYGVDTCYLLDTILDCPLVRFTDTTPGWNFKFNCQTSQPLVIPESDHILDGNGNELAFTFKAGRQGFPQGGLIFDQ